MADGDPWSLATRIVTRARDRVLYLAPGRLFEEFVVQVAAMSFLLDPDEELEPWLLGRADEAIDQLVQRDRELIRRGVPDALDVEASAAFLAGRFPFGPERAFLAATRFNGLAFSAREAYHLFFVERRSKSECHARAPRGQFEELLEQATQEVLRASPGSS